MAHGVIVATKEWLDKPAYEKGESLGRATTSLAADAAMGVLTEGLGTLGTLRKIERTAEAADHVRDAEKVVEKAAHATERVVGGAARRHTPDQASLIELAKEGQARGLSRTDAATLKQWGAEYGVPVRGPEVHPNRPHGKKPHLHVGPVDHIPVKD